MRKTLFALAALPLLSACSDSDNDDAGGSGGRTRIEGSVQKGQYVEGSEVVAYRLDDALAPTGESYPTQTSDDLGRFAVTAPFDEGYVELRATGYYYNENERSLSESTLSLQAVASVGEAPVRVNLLTSLTAPRIRRLAAAGMPFERAVVQAETELLRAVGMDGTRFPERFTEMDISRGREADAALLAASCLMQLGRSTGELSALIARIAGELAEEGTLSEALRAAILDRAGKVDIAGIVGGLLDFYAEKSPGTFAIPPFYTFLRGDAPLFLMLDTYTSSGGGVSEEGISGTFRVLATFDFTVTADCDWIEVERSRLTGDIYTVTLRVKPNAGRRRKGSVTFRNAAGEAVDAFDVEQNSVFQRIYLLSGNDPRSAAQGAEGLFPAGLRSAAQGAEGLFPAGSGSAAQGVEGLFPAGSGSAAQGAEGLFPAGSGSAAQGAEGLFPAGAEVLVNGRIHTVEIDEAGAPYVEVPKASRYTFCYPVGAVLPGDDPLCCTVEFPAFRRGGAVVPYYGAIVPLEGYPVANPALMRPQHCISLLRIELSGFEGADAVASVVVEGSAGEFLSGRATYLVYEDQPAYDPSYVPPAPLFYDASERVELLLEAGATTGDIPLFPQGYERLEITLLGAGEKPLARRTVQSLNAGRGVLQTIRITR